MNEHQKQQVLDNAKQICTNFNSASSGMQLKICNNAKALADFYKTYVGPKEFLYIAPMQEIEEQINAGAVYLCVTENGKLAGVCKASKLTLPYPFFCVPKYMNSNLSYWGLSGLYVHNDYRGKKYSTILLKAATQLAKASNAAGIYADFDFRNVASMRLVSKYYNLIGYTDGRNGSPDEATIYTTFFKDFTGNSKAGSELNIIFEDGGDMQSAKYTLDKVMENICSTSHNVVDYCDGFNEIVCFDRLFEFAKTNIIVKQNPYAEKEYKKMFDKH